MKRLFESLRALVQPRGRALLKMVVAAALTAGYLATYSGKFRVEPVAAATGSRGAVFEPQLPKGIPAELWRKLVPANNPLTAEKVRLGESLYFDKRLSADGTVSCATCHDPASAFADHEPRAVGVGGLTGTRNAPTILNAMFSESLFWDGRAASLEEQALRPLFGPNEMGAQSRGAVVAKVAAVPEYRQGFRRVFKDEGVTVETIAKAIAAFERTQLSGDSPFDRFAVGDEHALSEAQKRGWELFRGKARCAACHAYSPSSPFFTDFKFHNTGVGAERRGPAPAAVSDGGDGSSEFGRYVVTRKPADAGAFKTPTLRDIELTSPYMHDGSVRTLLDVVRFYNRGGGPDAHLDSGLGPLGLTDAEMSDLVEFMRALTGNDVLRQAQTAKPQTRLPAPLPGLNLP